MMTIALIMATMNSVSAFELPCYLQGGDACMGDDGADGADGAPGLNGADGADGIDGLNGKDADPHGLAIATAMSGPGLRRGRGQTWILGAGPCALRLAEMEKALAAKFAPESVAGLKIKADGLNSDLHASAEYRAHLITVMAKRAVEAALK
jgi:hypothetical protein